MIVDTLDQVVKDVIELGGADDKHRMYPKALKIAVRTLQDMSLYSMLPNYKTVELEVSNILTARLPKDCLRPVKVGKCVGGKIVEMLYNQDLCPKNSQPHCECDSSDETTTGTCSYCSFPNICLDEGRYSEFGEQYTVRPYPPLVGTFNYDFEHDLLIFDSKVEPGDTILFMYKTDIQYRDGRAIVPKVCFDPILYRCKELLFSRNSVDESRNRMLYEKSYSRIKKVYGKMTAQEWDAAMGGWKTSAPKR